MNILAASTTWFLDLFFPRACVGCNSVGDWICSHCQESGVASCNPRKEGEITSLFSLNTRVVREALHNLKYNGITEIATSLIEIVPVEVLREIIPSGSVLIPVPSTKSRLRQRGYNQVEVLATAWAQVTGATVWLGALERNGKQKTLVGQSADERSKSMEGAFTLRKNAHMMYVDRPWILIDDVVTTGSTLKACVDVLRGLKSDIKLVAIARA